MSSPRQGDLQVTCKHDIYSETSVPFLVNVTISPLLEAIASQNYYCSQRQTQPNSAE